MRYFFVLFSILFAAMAMTSCSDGPQPASAIGEAYAGPVTLLIRQDLSLKSPVVATVKHGEQLEVLSVRRRFMRVRVAGGVEGWCDSEKLLTTEQMGRLRAVAEAAAKLPSQAEATVFDARNVGQRAIERSHRSRELREGNHRGTGWQLIDQRFGKQIKQLVGKKSTGRKGDSDGDSRFDQATA